MIQGYLVAGAAGLALSVGAYFYGRNVESDIQEGIRTKAVLEQTQKTLEVERRYQELSNEVEREIKPKLEAAESSAVSLSRRLRDYQRRSCPVPTIAGTTPLPDDPPGDPRSDEAIERAAERVYGAAGRDAERLKAWQDWYGSVKNENPGR